MVRKMLDICADIKYTEMVIKRNIALAQEKIYTIEFIEELPVGVKGE